MPIFNNGELSLYWREVGNGPPVLLIMGLETDHRGWVRLVPCIRNQFRCVSFDNRDVGRSGLADRPYDVSDMAKDAIRLLDHLGLPAVNIIGQSLGGAIAQRIAHSSPERVKKLVLISSFASLSQRTRAALTSWKTLRRLLSLRDYYVSIFPWMYSDSDFATSGLIDRMLDGAVKNELPQSYEGFCRHVEAAIGFSSRSWLATLAVPTMIVSGEEDLITTPADASELASGIDRAELILLKDAGHGLVLTDAVEVASREVLRFLTSPSGY